MSYIDIAAMRRHIQERYEQQQFEARDRKFFWKCTTALLFLVLLIKVWFIVLLRWHWWIG